MMKIANMDECPQQKKRKPALLLVGEDDRFLGPLKNNLLKEGFLIREKVIGVNCKEFPEANLVDAVVVCSSGQDFLDGIFLLERMKANAPHLPFFMVARNGSEEKAVAAYRSGATDYFSGRLFEEDFCRRIKHHMHDSIASFDLSVVSQEKSDSSEPFLFGVSNEINDIRHYLLKVSQMNSTVLITGETGTGKELAADFIHWHSKRKDKPLIRINSSAMPEQLVESELFGHEKGAFTGAVSERPGKFEQADKGTLFLDEIGDMSSFAQAKILRILESSRVHRLGGRGGSTIDVRIIAATNQDLEKLIDRGEFRKDLFFRLNVARVHLPPLRHRREDIPILMKTFLGEFNRRFDLHVKGFSEKAWFSLMKYDWPGNIRELKNVLEATCITSPGSTVTFDNLPKDFQKVFSSGHFMPKSERDQVLSALFATNWNKSQAAHKLNWSRMTLYRKMAKHQIIQNRSIRTPFFSIRQ